MRNTDRPHRLHGRAGRRARPEHHGPLQRRHAHRHGDRPEHQVPGEADLRRDARRAGHRRHLRRHHHGRRDHSRAVVREGVRSVWELGQVQVNDGGADGDVDTTPNACSRARASWFPDFQQVCLTRPPPHGRLVWEQDYQGRYGHSTRASRDFLQRAHLLDERGSRARRSELRPRRVAGKGRRRRCTSRSPGATIA